MVTLDAHDEAWILECLALRETEDDEEPEIIVLSFGYADLYPDGTVVAFGRIVREADR